MRQGTAGFTLIELMIVVAIIGILAAIAIPAYSVYTARAQVAEGLALSSGVKNGIEDYLAVTGSLPVDANAIAMSETVVGLHVTGVTVANGAINVTFGNRANTALAGKALTLRPASSGNGDIVWICGYSDAPAGKVVASINSTDIEPRYLPNSCR